MTRIHLVLVCFGLAIVGGGCGLFSSSNAPGNPDGGAGGVGVGGACTTTPQCKTGLVCKPDSMTCQPAGDGKENDPCALSAACMTGLYCSPLGVCAKSGTIGKDGSCGKEGDCMSGLTCNIQDGLYGTCVMPGTGDVGANCTGAKDCYAGLVCSKGLCGPFQPPAPWPGAACDQTQDAVAKIYFKVPLTTETPNDDFYRLPFPNDIRMTAGHVSLRGHPHPGVQLLPVDLIDTYLRAVEKDLTGFGTNQAVVFRFSRDPDLGSLGKPNALQWVNITPGSPDYARPLGFSWNASTGGTKYICPRYIVLTPPAGVPMRPGETYAVILRNVITDGTKDGGGKAFGRDDDFAAMMADTAPSGSPDLANAWGAYAPLRAFVAEQKADAAAIVGATVFTTQKVDDVVAKMRAPLRAAAGAFGVKDLVKCDGPTTMAPCDDGLTGEAHERGCFAADPKFDEYQGRMTVPIFQSGTEPYYATDQGGTFVLDGTGAPVVQRTEDVCFALSVPKSAAPAAGFPVMVYGHGTGGSFRSAMDLAGDLANGDPAAAVLGFDMVEHGARRGASTKKPDDLVFNPLNPWAGRDNAMQAVADLMSAMKVVESWSGGGIKLDGGHVVLYGHSQGGNAAALAGPYEPGYRAVVLSGTGGNIKEALTHKTMPVNISGVLPLILDDFEDVNDSHPVVNILQMFFDRSDPVNYGRRFWVEPPMGAGPKSVLHVYGTKDTYAPVEAQQAFAQSASFSVVTPVIDDFGLTQVMSPVSGNVMSASGSATVVEAQYAPMMSDGHFVSTKVPAAYASMLSFIRTGLAGTPTFK